MEFLSFDGMAKYYDETRVFNEDCFNAALKFLVDRFPPDKYHNVFYPGIGTGRIAIPLAERGYDIKGVDISVKMLELLKERQAQSRQTLSLSFQKANVLKLPFLDETFDFAIVVHLFYFIQEWQQAVNEILRVVKGHAPVVLMHTGTGTEIPFLNTRYKELCAEQGCPIHDIGVRSTMEVTDYLKNLGYNSEWVRDRWQWVSTISIGKALYYLKGRAYSFTTIASDDIHIQAVERLKSELRQRFGTMTTKVKIPNQIYLVIISR